MSERKFARGLGKPGSAAQMRETVSQVVRESTVQTKPQLVEPIDFENFILKNKTLLQNDPQRELLLYPADDISQVVLPRRHRTLLQTVPNNADTENCNLFTKQCINTYSSNWNLVHYKYSAYSGTYMDLPKQNKNENLKEEMYEIDVDTDTADGDLKVSDGGISKEGYLMKGPEVGSDRMFANIGSKSFKRRFCYLRQEVDGTYLLDLYKDEKKSEAKATIVMDFCTDVVKNPKRGRFCFELRMAAAHKSYTLAADNETEFRDWLSKLSSVIQQNKIQEEKRAASLERASNTPPPSPLPLQNFGTLKGLEQSMNPQLMKYALETEISIALGRRENRRKLFPLYTQMGAISAARSPSYGNGVAATDSGVDPYKEQFGYRVLIKCDSIKFRLQAPIDGDKEALCQVEPYHTSLCLFDVRHGRKLTENFHFDVNHPTIRKLMQVPASPVGDRETPATAASVCGLPDLPDEWLTYPKQGLFSVSNPHADIFIVVRIDKILQRGIGQTTEPYVRATKDPRLGLKVHKSVLACHQRLGNYRMPFAWAARPLFRLYSNELDTSSDFPAIYRQELNKLTDDELLKLLSEFRKPDKFSKLTVIPGWIKIKIEALADLPDNCLTTSLVPLKPFPVPPVVEPTLEVTEFEGTSEKDVHPYTTFLNHLYVYPLALNFDTQRVFARARNIACIVEVRDSDADSSKPLKCIYGRAGVGGRLLTRQASCPVLHHNTSPTWYEEIKVRLPLPLLPSHHLLFTLYHVSCDITSKKQEGGASTESCIGYAWLPLLHHRGKVNIEMQTLPVATHLPPGYLSVQPLGLGKGNAGPEVTWVDGQKPLFTLALKLVSTVHTRDQHLHNLFVHAERLLEAAARPSPPQPPETETCKVLKALHAIQPATLITYLPTLLNQLFGLLVTVTASEEIGLNIIRVLINLVNMICEAGRKDTLHTYVKYVFVSPEPVVSGTGRTATTTTTVHEELSRHLPTILHPNNTDFLVVNKFMHHSDFFFEIMVKGMAQHLLSTGRIKMHRNERFSAEYLQRIEALHHVLVPYLIQKNKEMPIETQELNRSLANFIKRCLSLMDRGFIFKLINFYMDKFNPGDSRTLHEYKFTFLEVVCSHEHYVAFNLPLQRATRLSPPSSGRGSRSPPDPPVPHDHCLSEDFCRHHFMVGLLLQEVKTSLNEVAHIRRMALATLRGLLAKHELDDRYQSKGQMARIAAIYVPWLGIVLDNLNRLSVPHYQRHPTPWTDGASVTSAANRMSASSSYLFGKNSVSGDTPKSHRFTLHFEQSSPAHMRNSAFFDAIAGQTAVNGAASTISLDSDVSSVQSDDIRSTISQETTIVRGDPGASKGGHEHRKTHSRTLSVSHHQQAQRYDKLQPAEVRDILLCFLFVVKYLGEERLITWWQHCSDSDVVSFFSVLEMCLHCFRYVGKRNVQLPRGGQSATAASAQPRPPKAHTLPARMNPSEFSHDNTATLVIHTANRENLVESQNESARQQQALVEGNLATEMGVIILDCVGLYCIHFRQNMMSNDGDNATMRKIFDIYLSFMQAGQSEMLFRHVFAALRAYINNFSSVLFKGNADLCGLLCYELLRCCNSRLASIRQESCAILYLLMRSNFEFTSRKGLTRVHLQVIISVSQMLGNVVGLNNARFQESLSLINSFATSDKVMKGTGFPVEVKDLTKRVRTVLMATVQMREHHQDPEMLADLQHSLANSYASTPELRHTWLETMTRHHVRDGNYSEAACCQLHIAALMAEYLKLRNVQTWGAEAFGTISSNITRDERGLKLDAGVQDVQYSENTLLRQLETCADHLKRAERYELLGPLHRLVLPIHEGRRNYEALVACHQDLSQAYAKVIEVNKSGKRLLGRYYRVCFYGQAYFEEDSGIEYVYKEPKVTLLSEISERLYNQYCEKFGQEAVKMIMDSAPIDQNELDPKVAHIQVTHVTPYLEKHELDNRQTEFEQSHDIGCFMYETPFTKEGKARGNPEEQWKRRTILTTHYTFPYLKKRIAVSERRVLELSPIEVAIDEMQMRVSELEDVVFTLPTDAKKLQLRLQGSVCVQVNAGPLAYASVFLDPALSTMYPEDKVEELKDIFREFVKICYNALQINKMMITADQAEYHEVLKQNYRKLVTSLSTLFGEPLWPHEDAGSFKRNSMALFSAISGASHNSSTA